VDQASVDEAGKKAIDVVSVADTVILEQISEEDIAGLQAYIIHKINYLVSKKSFGQSSAIL